MIKHVVFISLPMSGRTYVEIFEDILAAKRWYLQNCPGRVENVAFISNFGGEYVGRPAVAEDREPVWFLGRAIQKMAKCDEVLFWGQWGKARGCLIEHEVAKKYKIPIIYGTDWSEEIMEAVRNIKSESNRNPNMDKHRKNRNELTIFLDNYNIWLDMISDLLSGDDLK